VPDAQKPDENTQETKATDIKIAQPAAASTPKPPDPPNPGRTDGNPIPAQPILARLIADGNDLKPFEKQSLAIARDALDISRKTYWVAICGFLAALAAAIFVGKQVVLMNDQTQIFASQTESAVAGGLLDQMNTRKQLAIAQQQAGAAQDSVKAIQAQMRQDHRAWIKIPPASPELAISMDGSGNKVFAKLTMVNVGRAPAGDVNLKVVIQLVKDGEAPNFSYEHGWDAAYGLLYPDDPIPPIEVTMMDTKGKDAILKDTELNDLISGGSYIAVYATVTYVDIFGIHHWTHSCGWKGLKQGKNYNPKNCYSYNQVDKKQ
jgi:hypothetical protein